jgi:hypothetical protein
MPPVGIAAVAYAVLAAIVLGGIVWGITALRNAGKVAQLAKDDARSAEVDHAMLQAETTAARDPAALDSTLRQGNF